MLSQTEKKQSEIDYSEKIINRATRALICAPFKLYLFREMAQKSVPLPEIPQKYTIKPISENKAERELIWLIKVGMLRREVDGQGITDSFRLTPLGRIVINQWQAEKELPQATIGDHLLNIITRWFNLS